MWFLAFSVLGIQSFVMVNALEEIIMTQLGYSYSFPVLLDGMSHDRMIVSKKIKKSE
jgi:hypothetical protein